MSTEIGGISTRMIQTNGRPEEELNDEHSTLFQHRPGLVIKPQPYPVRLAKKAARMLLPPIVTEAWYYLRKGR